jgi:hypothetical protein
MVLDFFQFTKDNTKVYFTETRTTQILKANLNEQQKKVGWLTNFNGRVFSIHLGCATFA